MIGGHALTPAADGSFAFYPGRFYRLVAVVNGAVYLEDVEGVLSSLGFGPIVSSDPHTWEHVRPPDWPDETPLPFIAANEALVRVSAGTGAAARPFLLERDRPIPYEHGAPARLTVVHAWDFGQAPPVSAIAGAAPPAAPPKKHGAMAAVLAVGGLAAVGVWHHVAEQRRLKREEQRLQSAEAKAEREEVASEMNRLIRAGYALPQAGDRVLEQDRAEEEATTLVILGVGSE